MAGESDCGKSFSSLIIARELAPLDQWAIIGTENRSDLYRTKFPGVENFELKPPFDPEICIEKMNEFIAKKKAGIIIDSASFFWDRMNDIAQGMKPTVKDGRQIWAKLTPRWNEFIHAINRAPCAMITTWKIKDEVVPGGPPKKKVICRHGGKGLKYDYHLVFSLNENRQAMVIKDNYDLFSDWKEPKQITTETGKLIAKWLKEN